MANYPIKETPVLDLAVRMFETTDRGHADIFNALGEILINNDAFLNAMVGKMIEKGMITHVLDSANASMVLGADVGPKIMQQINAVDKKVIDVSSDLTGKITFLSPIVDTNNYVLRKIGKVVILSLFFKISALPNGSNEYKIGILPAGFIPNRMYCATGQTNTYGSFVSGGFIRVGSNTDENENGLYFIPTGSYIEGMSIRGQITYFVK